MSKQEETDNYLNQLMVEFDSPVMDLDEYIETLGLEFDTSTATNNPYWSGDEKDRHFVTDITNESYTGKPQRFFMTKGRGTTGMPSDKGFFDAILRESSDFEVYDSAMDWAQSFESLDDLREDPRLRKACAIMWRNIERQTGKLRDLLSPTQWDFYLGGYVRPL